MELPHMLVRKLRSEPTEAGGVAVRRPVVTLRDLASLYLAENEARPVDVGLARGEQGSRCFGVLQPAVPLSHRQNIIQWMCDASDAIGWSYVTLFTAAYLFDKYVLTYQTAPSAVGKVRGGRLVNEANPPPLDNNENQPTSKPLDRSNTTTSSCSSLDGKRTTNAVIEAEDLPSLSAACLYVGACLRECMIDHTVISMDDFQRICPEIGSGYMIREQQLNLLSRGCLAATLSNRSPYDIASLYLNRMPLFPETSVAFNLLQTANAVDTVTEILMSVSVVCVLNATSLCIPSSSWVACTLAYIVQLLHTQYLPCSRVKAEEALTCLCEHVMEFPGGVRAVKKLMALFRPIIKATFEALNRSSVVDTRLKPRRPTRPHKPFLYRTVPGLCQSSICSYKSSLVLHFRKNLQPTLRSIQLEAMSYEAGYLPASDLAIARSNLPSDYQVDDDDRTLRHARRHTNICSCAQCSHYMDNPPDWRLFLKFNKQS